MRADVEACFEDATTLLKRSDIIKLMQGKLLFFMTSFRFFCPLEHLSQGFIVLLSL